MTRCSQTSLRTVTSAPLAWCGHQQVRHASEWGESWGSFWPALVAHEPLILHPSPLAGRAMQERGSRCACVHCRRADLTQARSACVEMEPAARRRCGVRVRYWSTAQYDLGIMPWLFAV